MGGYAGGGAGDQRPSSVPVAAHLHGGPSDDPACSREPGSPGWHDRPGRRRSPHVGGLGDTPAVCARSGCCSPTGYASAWRTAKAVAAARLSLPVLLRMLVMWLATVFSLSISTSAISRLPRPAATR